MSFLNPWGLLWLGSVPVLLWLWRMTSTHRRQLVSSLIPFEHLLQRQAKRRTRLVVNALFWLQLLALCGLSLALAQPLLSTHRSTVTLAVLDTSASMQAAHRGSMRFAHAKQRLLRELSRKGAFEQWLIMTTAPVAPLVPEPTNDALVLRRAVDDARAADVGGNLAATVRMGRALLRAAPTKTLIVTDETPPTQEPSAALAWHTIGQPRSNVAFVGLETQGPFCELAQARVIATVQNFSESEAQVTVRARQRSKVLAEERAMIAPQAQWPYALTLPPQIEGVVELSLATKGDALDVDDRAWIAVQPAATLPIVIDSSRPAFAQAMSTWLSACPSLTWSAQTPDAQGPHLLITDRASSPEHPPTALLTFLPPQTPRPIVSRWAVSTDHPIGSYLAPLDTVAAAVNLSDPGQIAGASVVDALIDGRRIPVVTASELEGRRHVVIRLDPAADVPSTPVVLTLLNSLRWLMESAQTLTTGEPLTVHGFASGAAAIRDPDGSTHPVEARAGVVQYEHTERAGTYHITQSDQQRAVAVNFLDPLESNLIEPASTWAAPLPAAAATTPASTRTRLPLGRLMIGGLLILLVIEWWLYSAKRAPSPIMQGPR
jgi:hypothetical protein